MQQVKYAYGYVRVSTDRQEELSPDSQEKLLREYAKQHNIVILKIFFEIGVSGRSADKRPSFQDMISLAKSKEHPVDLILVWKFSRFARNQEESIVYKSLLKKQHCVDVISVSEPLIDGPFGSLIERIIEWMDEYYSIRLSGEVLRGMREKAEKAGYQTAPPLGYKALGNGKPFAINEKQFKAVNFIFDQYDNHASDYTAIARKLNNMGYRTQRGKKFEARGVERILMNPFYYGLVVWNGISFMGSHETRLTKEQFESRMIKIQQRYKPHKRHDVSSCKHWLSGLLKCGYCGASLGYNGKHNRVPGFQCWKYAKGLHDQSCSISESKVTAALFEYFEHILSGGNFEYTYHAPETTEVKSQKDSLLHELEKISTREHRIRLAFEEGVDTLEEYKENKKRLKKAREDIQKEIDILDNPTESKVISKEDIMAKVSHVYDIIKNPDIDYEIKGNVLRDILESIVYDKENNRFKFRLYIS